MALHHNPSKVLSLLSARERHGAIAWSPGGGRASFMFDYPRARDVRVDDLSSAVAWNPSRMQNMILAVGPGTPASVLMKPTMASSSSSHSSDDMPSDIASDPESEDEDEIALMEDELARGLRRRRWTRRVLQSVQAARGGNATEGHDEEEDVDGAEDDAEEQKYDQTADEGTDEAASSSRRRRASSDSSRSALSRSEGDGTMEIAEMDGSNGDECSSSSSPASPRISGRLAAPTRRTGAPSMRHGGCINTAAWLCCPWRLSLAHASDDGSGRSDCFIFSSSHSSNSAASLDVSQDGREGLSSIDRIGPSDVPNAAAIPSEGCPSQLITSGDDRVVKFWDLSGAMGSTSPWPGGTGTTCPFSSPRITEAPLAISKQWKKRNKRGEPLSGMVLPLASIQTGHRGNVFHATPIPSQPGKVATCAADGYLRLCDVEMQSTVSSSSTASTIIISPELDDDADGNLPAGLLSLRAGMCFSHHFLDANSGLLCSERGLRRFDLRLSPREQPSRSILGGPFRTCKSCAIWSASTSGVGGSVDEEGLDSAYVFAGGSSGDVALYDLRMTDGTSSRIVQHYRPKCFGVNEAVSVSGIDVSRDKRELLVSYENDQIYTFPVFPHCSSPAGPSVEELASYSAAEGANHDSEDEGNDMGLLPELATYGGHLNRFTFLKMAKYAGPNDEYICTGSDSGHAWIYEKATGSVVSLLSADHSTCNGIVPHPTLPLFVTYGIDSTAKLWRATPPVDNEVDDSDLGRTKYLHSSAYEKSPLVRSWKGIQGKLHVFGDNEDDSFTLLPDEVPSRDDDFDDSVFGGLAGVLFRSARFGSHAPSVPYIGNDLSGLPKVLQQNYFACVRAFVSGDDEPIRSGLEGLKRRCALIRLRHQADQLGLAWDPIVPWIMRPKHHVQAISQAARDTGDAESIGIQYGNSTDLVPDHPGDWIPFDAEMTASPLCFGMTFNDEAYGDFFCERYVSIDALPTEQREEKTIADPTRLPADSMTRRQRKSDFSAKDQPGSNEAAIDEDICKLGRNNTYDTKKAWDILYETVLVLKEGGNAAMKAGAVTLAARRYDKAIRYCAIAFLGFPEGELEFLSSHQDALLGNGGHEVQWTPLLKALITTRLNLSTALLKPDIFDPSVASDQSRLALIEIKPFAAAKGKVMTGRKLDKPREGEPIDTYREAKEFQAKAYFRLASAQHAASDFAAAVKSFEHSIKSTKEANPNKKPEAVVLRRLAEAKRENLRKKKRQRKKFKFAFSGEDGQEENDEEKGEDKDDAREATDA